MRDLRRGQAAAENEPVLHVECEVGTPSLEIPAQRLSKQVTLSVSSVHRRTQKLLEEAGVTGERACAQTLRNTYAGLLIEGGASDEQLIDYLGLQASISAQRLRASFARAKAPPAQRQA